MGKMIAARRAEETRKFRVTLVARGRNVGGGPCKGEPGSGNRNLGSKVVQEF